MQSACNIGLRYVKYGLEKMHSVYRVRVADSPINRMRSLSSELLSLLKKCLFGFGCKILSQAS